MSAGLFLAWKYFKPKRSAVSVITLISIIGVALGVTVLIVVLAVMTGFSDKMREKLLDTTSHAQVNMFNRSFAIADPEKIAKIVKESGGAALPVTLSPVLLQKNSVFVPKVMVGIDPGEASRHFPLKEAVAAGRYSLKHGEVIVSYIIAREFGLAVGDKILLHSPSNLAKLVQRDPSGKLILAQKASLYLPSEFTVVGISSFHKYDFDRDFLFLNREDANELLGLDWTAATSIYVWVPDPFNMDGFMKKTKKRFSREVPYCTIESWQDLNKRLLGVLQVEKTMQFFLLVFIVLVAAFSITNTLITTVIQKTREIGLLKALGASSGTVMRIFILQGFFVGFIGTFSGIALGALIVKYRMAILKGMRLVTGMEIFPKEIYVFSELPANMVFSDVLWVAVISILLCTLGGVIPALRAAKLDPARALRYE